MHHQFHNAIRHATTLNHNTRRKRKPRRRRSRSISRIEIINIAGRQRALVFWVGRDCPTAYEIKATHDADTWEDLVDRVESIRLKNPHDASSVNLALVKWVNGPDSWESIERLKSECPKKVSKKSARKRQLTEQLLDHILLTQPPQAM